MGPEPLKTTLAALALASCARASAPPVAVAEPPALRHIQIVRAIGPSERSALVAKLRERNGEGWSVNEAALGATGWVVAPFAGFLRRARLASARPVAPAPVSEEAAVAAARGFVRKNADLLGLPPSILLTLETRARPAVSHDHAGPRATWAVRFEATFPSKGYEAFEELENKVDLEVFVDDDGVPSMLVNVSQIHPRLALDPRPELDGSDPRVTAKLLGRRVFALAADDAQIPLGRVEAADVVSASLVIHHAPGPLGAWITYRLAWSVVVAKSADVDPGSLDVAGSYYFFRWIVDADTGEVVADAVPPRHPESPPR